MNTETTELDKLRKKHELSDLTDEQWDKLQGECIPGCRISIYWKRSEEGIKHDFDQVIDKGYVFILPGMDASIADCYFHIPEPENPGGKDQAPEEFGYLVCLLQNPLVEMISCES